MFNPEEIKKDFPIFNRQINGYPLVYLDSAATAQKSQVVIDAIADYYTNHNANVHRGLHTLGDESTELFQQARLEVTQFLGAQPLELVWTRNTTEAINLVSYAWARKTLTKDDIIITSELEHHSNLVVWQEVARETGAQLTYVEVTKDGEIDLAHLHALLETFADQVKLLALGWVSNVTGAVLDIAKVRSLLDTFAKKAKLLLDAAQAVPQMKVDFAQSSADFLAFSGHKIYGPMGIGGLLVKQSLLNSMEPFLVGGGMIDQVHTGGTSFAGLPDRFDAGTPNVAGAVGLARAVGYLNNLGMDNVETHSRDLVSFALEKLAIIDKLHLIGPTPNDPVTQQHPDTFLRLGSVAFTLEGAHAHDVAQILDSLGIAVRSGHHCTMPLHETLGIVASVRASFGIYNTKNDVEALIEGIKRVKKICKI